MKKILFAPAVVLCTSALLSSCSEHAIEVSDISINPPGLSLIKGESSTLKAVFTSGDAAEKLVTWSNSDPDVISIDDAGRVTALNTGYALVTARTAEGRTAICTVTVDESTPVYAEGGYIGYGIRIGGTWWAPVNCGYELPKASSEYKGYPYGKLYQWGRKDGQGYDQADASYPSGDNLVNGQISDLSDLCAARFYGGDYNWYSGSVPGADDLWKEDGNTEYNPCPTGWRVPTRNELGALLYTDWNPGTQSGTTKRGVWNSTDNGWYFDSLFFPAAGHRDITGNAESRNDIGIYWSSTVSGKHAWQLSITGGDTAGLYGSGSGSGYRTYGFSVRCVK